ncbi:BspA family leucine-rich repeat surface protein, partial [Mycoplasma yeatsii]|uniref:BspA family leucine-rich repeat surface protein n=1 Tax=Mycoplasma yeatsii TaxID=51365 RepID=UPI000684FABA
TYSVKTDIASLQLDKHVGVLNLDDIDYIITLFIFKNSDKLPRLYRIDFDVISNENNVLKIKVKDNNKRFQGTVEFTYSLKTDIATLQLDKNVGAFNSNDINAIINAFIEKNKDKLPGLNWNSFHVQSNENGKLKIRVFDTNDIFGGTVEINYSPRDLFDTIQGIEKDITDLKNNDTESVLNRFVELNYGLLDSHKITRDQLQVEVSDNVAWITVKGNGKYLGSIQINLSLSKQLYDYLGVLSENDHNSILRRINNLNRWNLNLNDLNIQVQGNTATITAKTHRNEKFIGTITAQFGLRATYKDNRTVLTRIGFFKNIKGEWQIEQIDANTNKVVPTLPTFINSLESAFTQNRNTTISGLESWDTSNVTNMKSMFQNAKFFNQPLGEKFNTSKVTNMHAMFQGAHNFNQALGDKFDTSNVTDMSYMFKEAESFNSSLGNKFDTSNVTDMKEMFYEAHAFNKPLGDKFDTSKVTDMGYMFYFAESFNQPLNFNTSQVTRMSGMFYEARSFNQALNFNTSNVTNMNSMFNGAWSFNQSLGDKFDTSNVTDMSYMFADTKNFNQNISHFNTSKVIYMRWMFRGAESFNQNINTQEKQKADGSKYTAWDVSKVRDMNEMFKNARAFNQDISKWNVTISDTGNFKDFNSGAHAEFKDQKLPEKIRNSLRTNN